jgi:hypothetical protein
VDIPAPATSPVKVAVTNGLQAPSPESGDSGTLKESTIGSSSRNVGSTAA